MATLSKFQEDEGHKILFTDLSSWLKAAIIFGWISTGLILSSFLLGFLKGLMGEV